jgi:preprotein translocase subunit SecG
LFAAMVVFHTLVCILLVVVVLMQSSKGEGLAGAFGGGGSGLTGAVFGGRGAASFLSKATTVLAVVFFVNCGILAYMSSNRSGRQTTAGSESAVTKEAMKDMQRQQGQQQSTPVGQGDQTQPAGGETGLPPAETEGK